MEDFDEEDLALGSSALRDWVVTAASSSSVEAVAGEHDSVTSASQTTPVSLPVCLVAVPLVSLCASVLLGFEDGGSEIPSSLEMLDTLLVRGSCVGADGGGRDEDPVGMLELLWSRSPSGGGGLGRVGCSGFGCVGVSMFR